MGSGLNVPFYDSDKVSKVIGVDPAAEMSALGARRVAKSRVPVETIEAPGEDLPLEAGQFDTALLTYTACTIPGVMQALGEIRRVLKPSRQAFVPGARPIERAQGRVDAGQAEPDVEADGWRL